MDHSDDDGSDDEHTKIDVTGGAGERRNVPGKDGKGADTQALRSDAEQDVD